MTNPISGIVAAPTASPAIPDSAAVTIQSATAAIAGNACAAASPALTIAWWIACRP